MSILYKHGPVVMIDYTPNAAKAAGDVVVVVDECRILHSDIEADVLGAIAAPAGGGVYEGPKATTGGSGWSDGDPVYWDESAGLLSDTDDSGANKQIGTAIHDVADADETARFRHHA